MPTVDDPTLRKTLSQLKAALKFIVLKFLITFEQGFSLSFCTGPCGLCTWQKDSFVVLCSASMEVLNHENGRCG